jgi:hypothetical protein
MRRVGQVLVVISTLICLLVCVAWSRSIGWSESIQHITQFDTAAGTSVRLIRIIHANGIILITRTSGDERVRLSPLNDRGWKYRRTSVEAHFLMEGETLPKKLGFQYSHASPMIPGALVSQTTSVGFPHWAIIIPTTAPAIAWLLLRRRAARAKRDNMCPQCGYDLRATPQRCPECGLVMKEHQAA